LLFYTHPITPRKNHIEVFKSCLPITLFSSFISVTNSKNTIERPSPYSHGSQENKYSYLSPSLQHPNKTETEQPTLNLRCLGIRLRDIFFLVTATRSLTFGTSKSLGSERLQETVSLNRSIRFRNFFLLQNRSIDTKSLDWRQVPSAD